MYKKILVGIVGLLGVISIGVFVQNGNFGAAPSPSFAEQIIISNQNSSSDTLSDGSTFTGGADYNTYNDVLVSVKTDADGTLYTDFSHDGTNWDSTLSFDVAAGINEIHELVKGHRYFRVRFTDDSDGTSQTYFRLQTEYGTFDKLTTVVSGTINDDQDALAIRPSSDYQLDVAAGRISGMAAERKFAKNADVDTGGYETVWSRGGLYVWATTSEEVTITSTDANDASGDTGARTVRLYCLNDSFVANQIDVVMNGTSGTTTNTGDECYRLNRAAVLTAGSSGFNEGTITIQNSQGTVLGEIPAELGFTYQMVYTVPANNKAFMRGYVVSAARLASQQPTVEFDALVRPSGGAWGTIFEEILDTDTATDLERLGLPVYNVLTAGTDAELRASTDIDNTQVYAQFYLNLLEN